MEINTTGKHLQADSVASDLLNYLQHNEVDLRLERAQVYYDFPVFKDESGGAISAKILLVSPHHGVVVVQACDASSRATDVVEQLSRANETAEQVSAILFSRLIRNRELRSSTSSLRFQTKTVLFVPLIASSPPVPFATEVLLTLGALAEFLKALQTEPMLEAVFTELIATIEGAKGFLHPKARDVADLDPHSKGSIANRLEAEIASFDQRQKHGYMTVLDGLQRVRGLAGSGKTIVLAMKAALTHLRDPEAKIVYTFYTKSLYQHIRRLITRFYRQFDDRDPDWTQLEVIHAWGGSAAKGVYYNACVAHGVQPIPYSRASQTAGGREFDFVCTDLLGTSRLSPQYDYVFIDEGQDFPASFIRLATKLAVHGRVVYAYDDLQSIWQRAAPTLVEIVGCDEQGNPLVDYSADIVLYKCYRNPREVLVCAHALGFGIYGPKIVQMLENAGHWEDIGYRVISGDFTAGSPTVIERPKENSLTTISNACQPEEIVAAAVYESFEEETLAVAAAIRSDIVDGLRPEDILVIVVDDRSARAYLEATARALSKLGINTNNLHADPYGIRDFQQQGCVTLSTVHKAKGNEALMVYVVGVDALYATYAGVRERNMLFTAMTRAKGWVRVSGIGDSAVACKRDIDLALENFPYLRFVYPSELELKIMRRDLAEKDRRKMRAERLLDQALDMMSPEEITRFLEQRSIRKGD